MSRHLKRVHGGEPLVAAAVAEKDEPTRSRMFQKIQNLGNFVHNTNVSYHLPPSLCLIQLKKIDLGLLFTIGVQIR